MKIIYLDSGRLPTEKAYGYQIVKMCEAMAELGHEVTLVTSRRRNTVKDELFAYYGVKKNFIFQRLPSIDLVNIVPKYGSWISRLSFLLMAKVYLAFQRYDALYIREHMSGVFFRDYIMEVHQLPKIITKRDQRIWQRAQKIVVTTKFIKERLEKIEIAGDKIVVAPDAVDHEVFGIKLSRSEARQKLGLPQDEIILGYTGSLKTKEMEKGVSIVLQALAILDEKVKFIAVGGIGRHIREYQALAHKMNVDKRVQFLRRVPPPMLAIYQQAFDMLLLPFPNYEHYAYFASPLKLFEYMVSGRPIVASDLPSLREILNEQNARLAKPDDANDLARAVVELLQNKDLGERLAEQAYQDVRLNTWQSRAKIILP